MHKTLIFYFSNKFQQNLDGDELGDDCDEDMDNDGLANSEDNCPRTRNMDQADTDGDGVGNICDNCPDTFNPLQDDVNHNLIGKNNLI
jgi:syndecan 4